MRAIMAFMVFTAGFSAHSAINQKSNADCRSQKGFPLWQSTAQANPVEQNKAQPAKTQIASKKQSAQGG